jgi:hypothetical protein
MIYSRSNVTVNTQIRNGVCVSCLQSHLTLLLQRISCSLGCCSIVMQVSVVGMAFLVALYHDIGQVTFYQCHCDHVKVDFMGFTNYTNACIYLLL